MEGGRELAPVRKLDLSFCPQLGMLRTLATARMERQHRIPHTAALARAQARALAPASCGLQPGF
jgi:hypothetical protein